MKASDFHSIKLTEARRTQPGSGAATRSGKVCRVTSAKAPGRAGYDSLMDYWIFCPPQEDATRFALVGLAAAVVIAGADTAYRVRTSRDPGFSMRNFMDIRAWIHRFQRKLRLTESYVETQAKILQSESLLER